MGSKKRELLGFLIAGAIVIALPLITRNPYVLSIGIFIGLYGMVALGLGMLLGYAGQVSLGQAAFYGLGAYGSAIFTLHWGWNPWLAMLVAALLTVFFAWLVGRPALRLHGHYLAMATLGIGIIVQILLNEGGELTGGPSGMPGVADLQIGSFVFDNDFRVYCLVWPLVLLQVLLTRNLLHSRLGRALRAIHDSEIAAKSCAVDVARAKVRVFMLSAAFASLAGSLYVHWVNFANPSPFGFAFSIEVVAMVIVGGAGSLWGPLIGSAALMSLSQGLKFAGHLPYLGMLKELDVVLYGLILVLMLLFHPKGLARIFGAFGGGRR